MANELETAIKNAATAVAQYVKDVSEMTVETRYVDISGEEMKNFDQARPVARTIVRLDGDSQTVVPVRPNAAGVLEVDDGLFELHRQNVATTIDYRSRILNALLGILQTRRIPPV